MQDFATIHSMSGRFPYVPGWWFGTFFPYMGNNHPNWLIFFRGVGIPPTRVLWTIINHIITININHYLQYINHILTTNQVRSSNLHFFGRLLFFSKIAMVSLPFSEGLYLLQRGFKDFVIVDRRNKVGCAWGKLKFICLYRRFILKLVNMFHIWEYDKLPVPNMKLSICFVKWFAS